MDLINKTKIYTMKVKFLYILEYIVIDFLLMYEIDKMWKIENSKIQSHTIHKITQRFVVGNHYGRKPSYKVRFPHSLLSSMETLQVQRRMYSLQSDLRPMAC
jgi:hypothetical protein